MPPQANPWRARLRRLIWLGTATTSLYLLISYLLDRAREARLRAVRQSKDRDILKQHYTSLISTISFTLYALLPTLQPQLAEEYPVEATSMALQGLSAPSSTAGPTPDSSMVLPPPHAEDSRSEQKGGTQPQPGVEESWTSEFQAESVTESEDPSLVGSSMVQQHEDDAMSSGLSQSISLPPTDTSSFSPSPPSELSPRMEQSPPRAPQNSVTIQPPTHKSKKELWRDLKLQTITRTLTTAYLLPLLYLLTSSQLATLARIRYLDDVASSLPELEPELPKRGLLGYFSADAMGLSDFVENHTPGLLNPSRYLPTAISSYLPFGRAPTALREQDDPEALRMRKEQIAAEKSEDEKAYLTYSWWILHEGWKGLGQRVANAVEEVLGGMALKRELGVQDWERLIREVRARVETVETSTGAALYSFFPHVFPPNPIPSSLLVDNNPLPLSPPSDRPHLLSLLEQTRAHLLSADATFLIEKGVTVMVRKMLESLQEDSYSGSEIGLILGEHQPQPLELNRRLVDCLPAIDRWGKGVWEAVPDSGIENMTNIPEFEGFSALVFGDWAPREGEA